MKTVTARATIVGGTALFSLGFAYSVLGQLPEGYFAVVPILLAGVGLAVGRLVGGILEPPEPGLEEVRVPMAKAEETTLASLTEIPMDAAAVDAVAAPSVGWRGRSIDTVLPEIPPS